MRDLVSAFTLAPTYAVLSLPIVHSLTIYFSLCSPFPYSHVCQHGSFLSSWLFVIDGENRPSALLCFQSPVRRPLSLLLFGWREGGVGEQEADPDMSVET